MKWNANVRLSNKHPESLNRSVSKNTSPTIIKISNLVPWEINFSKLYVFFTFTFVYFLLLIQIIPFQHIIVLLTMVNLVLNKAKASLHVLRVHPVPVRHGSIQPRPVLVAHVFYWVLSPVLLDRPIYLTNFPSMASHHVLHNFIHLSPGPTVLGCICYFKPTQVLFMCHGLNIFILTKARLEALIPVLEH